MRSMFSTPSARRKSGLSEANCAIPVDLATQTPLVDWLNNEVDRSLWNCFEATCERVDSAEWAKPCGFRNQPHEIIYVGIVPVTSSPACALAINSDRSTLPQSGIAEMIRAFSRISACSCK